MVVNNEAIRWIVQTKLGSPADPQAIIKACEEFGIECVQMNKVIPFSREKLFIPKSDKMDIFYGSISFVDTHAKGQQKRNEKFTYRKFVEHYGDHMINKPIFMSFGYLYDYLTKNHEYNALNINFDEFFIKPVDDSKIFTGMVTNKERFVEWGDKIVNTGYDDLTIGYDTPIFISNYKEIECEWRLFMVNGYYSTGSLYKCGSTPIQVGTVKQSVIEYAERMAALWCPDERFVMDIGQVNGELKIIECGVWNSCGLYEANVSKLVEDISKSYL